MSLFLGADDPPDGGPPKQPERDSYSPSEVVGLHLDLTNSTVARFLPLPPLTPSEASGPTVHYDPPPLLARTRFSLNCSPAPMNPISTRPWSYQP
jgi:hypothetical protein